MIGTTISHYKILDRLGKGGMGEVWKAEDTQLRRTVALKFISSEAVGDDEIKARLIREAQASASLDHPNICQVFGIHEEQGETFIAMAYIDGPSLAEKIKERPLPLDEALNMAIQIADGLQEAHEKDIVHRDIKPQNIMLTAKGQVKIMDFGLAAVAGRSRLTKTGTTLGTPAYMSPEQLEGRDVDRRADIWALGCVLYEMLTQRTPFDADYEQAIAYGILNEEPEPVTALRSGVSTEIDRLLGKALAKSPDERYQHVDELIVDLRGLDKKGEFGRSKVLVPQPDLAPSQADIEPPRVTQDSPAAGARPALGSPQTAALLTLSEEMVPKRKHHTLQALFAVTVIALLAVSYIHLRQTLPRSAEASLGRFAFTPESLYETNQRRVAISPNGRHIAYVGGGNPTKLWVRDLDLEQPRELAGTEGASSPFWSPDSRSIGFATTEELKKISLQGGPVITLCHLFGNVFDGGSWSSDGNFIAFGSEGLRRIYEVSARGGEPQLLFEPETSERGVNNSSPYFLPSQAGVRSILFTVGGFRTHIAVKNLVTGAWELLLDGAYPVYSPSGHIVYQTDRYESGVWALPFSLETLKPTGEAFPIAEEVGKPSVGADGTLVHVDLLGTAQQQLLWRDREGKELSVIGRPQQNIRYPAVSPDGRRVAAEVEETNRDVWVYEIERAVGTRLTFDPGLDTRPIWSPSGEEITFQSFRLGNSDIFRRSASSTDEPELLVGTELDERPYDWSDDGRLLLYTVADPKNGVDLWYLKRKEGDSGFESVAFLRTPFNEQTPDLSTDGRSVAYCSDESGQYEVYVQAFPKGRGKEQISTNGGCQPRWSHDGRELFYVQGDTLMVVALTTTANLLYSSPTRLFQDPNLVSPTFHRIRYDVSADGRFLMVKDSLLKEELTSKPAIHIVQNWHEEFRDRE